MTGRELFFAALITLCGAVGLLFSSRILEGKGHFRREMFVYYTYLSNAAVFLYHLLLLLPGGHREALRTPTVRFCAMMTILITFLIYFFIITRFGWEPEEERPKTRLRRIGNVFVHYIIPPLCFAEWLAVAEKSTLGIKSALWWLPVPLAYILFAVCRAQTGKEIEHTGRVWPYAFVDKEKIGAKAWWRNLILCLLGVFLLAAAVALLAGGLSA